MAFWMIDEQPKSIPPCYPFWMVWREFFILKVRGGMSIMDIFRHNHDGRLLASLWNREERFHRRSHVINLHKIRPVVLSSHPCDYRHPPAPRQNLGIMRNAANLPLTA